MYLPPNIYKLHIKATDCCIYYKPFTGNNYKVHDHNHLTGEYRGAAHNKCNLIISYAKYIPVFVLISRIMTVTFL